MNTRGRAKSIRDDATLQEDNATLYVEEESLAGGSSSVVAVKEDVDEEEQEPTAVSEYYLFRTGILMIMQMLPMPSC